MLKFCFGPSGSGKSYHLFKYIIEESKEHADTNYLYIVPDQFTMQSQMDIVKMHPDKGIMNIDVLSFGRLAHRVFEEKSADNRVLLDDVGKSLILRYVASKNLDSLKTIGPFMNRAGYIDEVKSTISEFMQYNISSDDLQLLIDNTKSKRVLSNKLCDLKFLYEKFLDYIKDNFTTSEEMLNILCDKIEGSNLIKNSVIVFDGFTGFTPIQYNVIEKLLKYGKEVTVSLEMDDDEDPFLMDGRMENIFFLSKKTVNKLIKCEYKVMQLLDAKNTPPFDEYVRYRKENTKKIDTYINRIDGKVKRLENVEELSFLEKNLFRYKNDKYAVDDSSEKGINSPIIICGAEGIEAEVRAAFVYISKIIRENKDIFYKDFAICCGDIDQYEDKIKNIAPKFELPVYIDKTNNIRLNPLIEYIKSGLSVIETNYSYEAVFHLLRAGVLDIDSTDIDLFENYIRGLGIRGKKAYSEDFVRKYPQKYASLITDEGQLILLSKMNDIRKKISYCLEPINDLNKEKASKICTLFYEFLERSSAFEKMNEFSLRFEKENDISKSKEYSQIYDKVINLLTQIYKLIGDEEISISEFEDILDAGFAEIEVGTIPQKVDTIRVGDIVRSRLGNIKYLIFLGVNDAYIPGSGDSGGLLSDIDRAFIESISDDFELAPSPREQMYTQRLYLYTSLSKPSKALYMSYSYVSLDGKSLRPSYIISKIKALFPRIREINDRAFSDILFTDDAAGILARDFRDYVDGNMTEDREISFLTLFDTVEKENVKLAGNLKNAAFLRYEGKRLSNAVASILYGTNLENSVSRLELFASCCYAHFLKYGLELDERNEYELRSSDIGNVFHLILERFTNSLEEKGLTFRTFGEDDAKEMLYDIVDTTTREYGDTILYSNARTKSVIDRIYRIVYRSVMMLQYQIKKGSFDVGAVEFDFKRAGSIDEINVSLSKDKKEKIERKMHLKGRIDRIDTASDDENIYVKIIDFKSGNKTFDIAAVYYGLSLQLVLYMNVAASFEKEKNKDKQIIPAALLYYHVSDPVVSASSPAISEDDINTMIRKKLRPSGIAVSDEKIISLLDNGFAEGATDSDVIPIRLKKDGSFYADSKVISSDDFKVVSGYVGHKIREYGNRILDGDIDVNPYEMKKRDACTYCAFHSICGFDKMIDGFNKRTLEDLKKDEALEKMKHEIDGEKSQDNE